MIQITGMKHFTMVHDNFIFKHKYKLLTNVTIYIKLLNTEAIKLQKLPVGLLYTPMNILVPIGLHRVKNDEVMMMILE